MSKLTKKEREEMEIIMENWLEWFNINRDGTITELLSVDKNKLIRWLEQKKKEWQESGALKMLNYCIEISDGSISPMYSQSKKEFEQEFLEGSGIRP